MEIPGVKVLPKLRASWGLLGNQETVNSDNSSNYYPYQNTYLFGYDYSFGNTLTPGISISNPMANQDITWEKTDQWNVVSNYPPNRL